MRGTTVIRLATLTIAVAVAGCSRPRVPDPGSPAYENTVRSFYRALAELQVGLLDDAQRNFATATELAPGEPAAWANLGLAHLRLGEFDAARPPVDKAVELDPKSSDLIFLRGRLETSQGKLDEGIADYRRAADLDPRNLRVRYALAEEVERAGGPNADAEAQRLFEEILKAKPGNIAVVLERARIAAKRRDAAALGDSLRTLEPMAAGWPASAVEQLRGLKAAVAANNFQDAARSIAFLRNVLVRDVTFRESLAAVRTPTELIAEPFETFLKMPSPSSKSSPADDGLTFTREVQDGSASSLVVTALDDSGVPAIVTVDDHDVVVGRSFQGGLGDAKSVAPQMSSLKIAGVTAVAPLDWNRDFKMDLAVAGKNGVRIFTQQPNGSFADATPKNGGIAADTFGVWAVDVEMDGDLDLVAGIRDAAPIVLRNNGDGTWTQLQPFGGVTGVRAFAWGDVDGDGDPDAVLVGDRGDLHVFENRQAGVFREMARPSLGAVMALAIGDLNADGALDIVALEAGGAIKRASWLGGAWQVEDVARWPDAIDAQNVGKYRLFLADIDNNGALDVVVSGAGTSHAWLFDAGPERPGPRNSDVRPGSQTSYVERPFQGRQLDHIDIFSVADLNGDGQLDLAGIEADHPVRLLGKGTKSYHWQVLRPKAQPTAGDQRINSFGVGGEAEIRSGLLTQKQTLTGQPVHFGLGTLTGVDVARIVWPNGIMQADFDTKADASIVAEQRLKGSCPWVFAYDGHGMRFVTDFLWRSPLGLRINAVDTAGVTQTEDWVKIRGDQLVARDGVYDVRITAELWETHFIDHVSLMVVDHPVEQDVFVDERFAREAPALAVHTLTHPRPVAHAWDDAGRDVTDLVAERDGRYLATFERGEYQGIAKDHFVEIDLGGDPERVAPQQPLKGVAALQPPLKGLAPQRPLVGRSFQGRRWLVANGWIYPTDSSINVAIGQQNLQPHGISLEAQDDHRRWVVVAPDLGFPAGKNKTILIDLASIARAGIAHPKRIRLRTNLEVYWDQLALADDAPDSARTTQAKIAPASAELRFRGFSKTDHARREVPETPRYDELANIAQRWRDLTGYYTRFGDVRELLSSVDDRYVIMNAGDELRLSFPAPAAPQPGFTRDFVLVGDGWEKDGDYNTTASSTVEPLPRHGHPEYKRNDPPESIEDDPVYRAHPADWQTYHTRFVDPRAFLSGLR